MINKLIEAQFKKNSKMCYTLDIDEIRAIVKDIGSRVSNPEHNLKISITL